MNEREREATYRDRGLKRESDRERERGHLQGKGLEIVRG